MNTIVTLLVTMLACLGISGCSGSPSSLVGTYSIEERGQLKEFIRIEKNGEKFTLSEKAGGNWIKPVEVTTLSKDDFEKIIKEPVTVDFIGLGNKNAAIIKVPKGWRTKNFESKTGVWLASVLGPIELHKN